MSSDAFFPQIEKEINENDVEGNDEPCFVMYPFDEGQKVYSIAKRDADILDFKIVANSEDFKNINTKGNSSERKAHIELVSKAISEIKKRNMSVPRVGKHMMNFLL